MARADFRTFSTADTFFGIDCRMEVFDFDGAFLTGFYAFHTTDTTHVADLHRSSALVTIGTEHFGLLLGRVKLDQVTRAGSHSHATGFAAASVDTGQAVANFDGAIWTCRRTIAQTDATEATVRRPAGHHGSCRTGSDAVVDHFVVGYIQTAGAGNYRGFAFHFAGFCAQNSGNLSRTFLAAGRT